MSGYDWADMTPDQGSDFRLFEPDEWDVINQNEADDYRGDFDEGIDF